MILLDVNEFAYIVILFFAIIVVVILVSMLIFGVFFIKKIDTQGSKFQELFTAFNDKIGRLENAVSVFAEKFDNLNSNANEIRIDIEKYVAEYKEGLRTMEQNYRLSAGYYNELDKKILELNTKYDKMMHYIRQLDQRVVAASYHIKEMGHLNSLLPNYVEFTPTK